MKKYFAFMGLALVMIVTCFSFVGCTPNKPTDLQLVEKSMSLDHDQDFEVTLVTDENLDLDEDYIYYYAVSENGEQKYFGSVKRAYAEYRYENS